MKNYKANELNENYKEHGRSKTDNLVVSQAMIGSSEALQRAMAEVGTVRPSYRYESLPIRYRDRTKFVGLPQACVTASIGLTLVVTFG